MVVIDNVKKNDEVSKTQWNIDDIKIRSNKRFSLSVDASINPLKGKIKND